ncbi:RPII140-upstream gene protein [Phymastichus coffea]|uniref:RPII140-upstream gene protein n=1 Tax=Phymastichus coffea TaxID=108790 RepID=UPI00273A79FD|nr:RPII140-upstream gene protein [Phymastichus coffea]
MFKFVKYKRLYAITPFIDGIFDNENDRIKGDRVDQVYSSKEADNISGWQRLKNLFKKHDDDIVHPVVTDTIQTAMGGFIFGGVYGALIHSRAAFIKFIETNEATQFRNHLDAKRKLSDAMFASYLKGFGQWGIKIGFFVTTFTFVQQTLSVYQNKYAFWHYSVGGATAGSLYKFQLGPKGMVSGAIFGGLFGTLYGSIKVILLKLTNISEEDLLEYKQNLVDMKHDFDWKWIKSRDTKQIEKELEQAMMNPKGHIDSS